MKKLLKICILIIISYKFLYPSDILKDVYKVKKLITLSKKYRRTNPDSSKIIAQSILKITLKYLDKTEEQNFPDSILIKLIVSSGSAYNVLGRYFYTKGQYDSAYYYYHKQLDITNLYKKDTLPKLLLKQRAYAYFNLANILAILDDIPGALEYYNKSAELFREIGNTENFISINYNIATLFHEIGRTNEAIKILKKGLKSINNNTLKAQYNLLLTIIAISTENDSLVKKQLKELLTYKNIINKLYPNSRVTFFKEISNAYIFLNQLDSAKKYIELGDSLIKKHNIKGPIYYEFSFIKAKYLIKTGNFQEGEKILQQIYQNNNLYYNIRKDALKELSDLYQKLGDKDKAIYYLNKLLELTDSANLSSQIKEVGATFSRIEMEKQMLLEHLQHQKEKEIAQERIKRQRIIIYASIIILTIIIIFIFILFNRYKIIKQQKKDLETAYQEIQSINAQLNMANEELNQINAELKEANLELERRHRIIREKNKAILESITAARRIQSALIPPEEVLKNFFNDAFVIYLPRDLVSGDFYWIGSVNNSKYIAVADCTGHGVPAALLSMLGQMALNTALNELNNPSTNNILSFMQSYIINALQKYGSNINEGMEISLLRWIYNQNIIEISNAKRFVLLKSNLNNSLLQVKGDSHSISPGELWKYERGKNIYKFSKYTYKLKPNEIIKVYFSTDGYTDQIGYVKTKNNNYKLKKIGTKRFAKLINKITHLPLHKQKQILLEFLHKWQGEQEQLDDITVIAIEIKYNKQ